MKFQSCRTLSWVVCFVPKLKALRFCEMSVTVYQSTQRHISEECSLEHHHSAVLRSRTLGEFLTTTAVPCLQLQWNILLIVSLHRRSHVTHGTRKQADALGAFAKLQKATISFVMFVCLFRCSSVRPSACNNSAPTGRIFMKFEILLFTISKICMKKFEFHYNLTRIKGTLHEYLCTFMLIKKQSHYRPEVPRGFQEVKVPILHDNGPGWW